VRSKTILFCSSVLGMKQVLRLNFVSVTPLQHRSCSVTCLSSGWVTTTGRLLGFKMGNSINSLFTWSKLKWLFLEGRFFPANQGFLKTIQMALIGWIKVGPPKKPLLFWSWKQAISIFPKDTATCYSIGSQPRLRNLSIPAGRFKEIGTKRF